MPFLSIIIAAHNSDNTLSDTFTSLRSALGTTKDVEIIIINDNSTDNTQNIINIASLELPNVINEYVIYNNIGKVRQHAISLSSGEYITILDSDDLLKPQSLQDAISFLREYKPDILITPLIEIRDLTKITSNWSGFTPKRLTNYEAIRRFLISRDFQGHLAGKFIHRSLYLQAQIPPATCYEDSIAFSLILKNSSKIYYQNVGFYYYIKRQDSLTNTPNAKKISYLFNYILYLEHIFPSEFQAIINCRWFDIYIKYRQYLNSSQLKVVKSRVKQIYSLTFFLSKNVRFSYKKRVIQALWKK